MGLSNLPPGVTDAMCDPETRWAEADETPDYNELRAYEVEYVGLSGDAAFVTVEASSSSHARALVSELFDVDPGDIRDAYTA